MVSRQRIRARASVPAATNASANPYFADVWEYADVPEHPEHTEFPEQGNIRAITGQLSGPITGLEQDNNRAGTGQ
jgi:hypothetical protein